MNMHYKYDTTGVCSSCIELNVQENTIKEVKFIGGCDGNLKGLSRLVAGLSPSDAAERLSGIKCGKRNTSCPDQLAKALAHLIHAGS